MKICVFGAGALGGYLCVQLASSPLIKTLNVVARGDQFAAIQRQGLRVLDAQGASEQHTHVHQATDQPKNLGQHNLVIVTLKANAIASCAQDINALIAPNGLVLFVNNGIPWWWDGSEALEAQAMGSFKIEEIGKALLPSRVLGSVAMSNSEVILPGVIRHNSMNTWFSGETSGEISHRLGSVWSCLPVWVWGQKRRPTLNLKSGKNCCSISPITPWRA